MTSEQRIQLRLSEVRSRLNEIAGLDELDAEIRTEADALQVEYQDLEIRHRAAITGTDNGAQDLDGSGAGAGEEIDAEAAEVRALVERSELRRFMSAAIAGRAIDGAEAELSEARGLADGAVPWDVIAPRRESATEARADAATALPAAGASVAEQDYVGRVFGTGAANYLAVRVDVVPSGEASYFVIGSGSAAPATVAEGAIKESDAASLTGIVCEPHRLTAAYTIRVEDLARSMRLEDALREDLSAALNESLDDAVINGGGGLLNDAVVAAPDAPGAAVANMTHFVTAAAAAVDGKLARNLLSVRSLVGPKAYQVAASAFSQDGETTGSDYLIRRSGGFQTSALIPAPALNIEQGLMARVGMPGNAVVAIWSGLNFTTIRDEFTRAHRGEIRLQAIALYDFKVLRAAGFRRHAFRVAL